MGRLFVWRDALCRIRNVVVVTEHDSPIPLREGEAPAEPTSPDWGVFTAEAVPFQTKPACAGCATLRRQGSVWAGTALAVRKR